MAKRKISDEPPNQDNMSLIARLLGALLVRELEPTEATNKLAHIGFDDNGIASIVGISESAVRGIRFRSSKAKRKPNKHRGGRR